MPSRFRNRLRGIFRLLKISYKKGPKRIDTRRKNSIWRLFCKGCQRQKSLTKENPATSQEAAKISNSQIAIGQGATVKEQKIGEPTLD